MLSTSENSSMFVGDNWIFEEQGERVCQNRLPTFDL